MIGMKSEYDELIRDTLKNKKETEVIAKQIEIFKLIDEFYEYTNNLKNSYLDKNNQITSLKQSILQKAFSGELVKD